MSDAEGAPDEQPIDTADDAREAVRDAADTLEDLHLEQTTFDTMGELFDAHGVPNGDVAVDGMTVTQQQLTEAVKALDRTATSCEDPTISVPLLRFLVELLGGTPDQYVEGLLGEGGA